jgi:hypothetical protein
MRRRSMVTGAAVAAVALSTGLLPGAARARRRAAGELWVFDTLRSVGGRTPELVGAPTLATSPWGRATMFDGVDDGLLIDRHPLAGARSFTIEALFRPDGGAFEQRWLHLETEDGSAPGLSKTRILFEIRVVGESWYLDAFTTDGHAKQTLIVPANRFPIGRWYHVAQSYDGTTYRSYVDGVVQMEVPVHFDPQGPGRAAIGMRMNRVNFFHGAVRAAFFAQTALAPADFVLPPVPRAA